MSNIHDKLKNHYEGCLEKHRGKEGLEVDWTNLDVLGGRYDAMLDLLKMINVVSEAPNLLDVGSGTSSIVEHYKNKQAWDEVGLFNYYACDLSLEMLKEAIRRTRMDRKYFYIGDGLNINRTFDAVLCNGTYTESLDVEWYAFWTYVKDHVTALFSKVNVGGGLAFNLLNYHSVPLEDQRKGLFFVDYSSMAELASSLTNNYTIRTGYGPKCESIVYLIKE